jgi:hypothetical protein
MTEARLGSSKTYPGFLTTETPTCRQPMAFGRGID